MRRLFLPALALVPAMPAESAPPPSDVVAIWGGAAPGSERRAGEQEQLEGGAYVHNVHRPSLTILRPRSEHANGTAIIIAPGGGHRMLVFQNEGMAPARILTRYGITVFVLRYRLAREPGSTYTIEHDATADARRAVRWVRAHAADYGVSPRRIGLMGFSAGGELVSLVADNFESDDQVRSDRLARISGRPDFQVLVYPGPIGIPAADVAHAPPAFIAAGALDTCCAGPALTLFQQLKQAGRTAELHIFSGVGHGFNVGVHDERLSIQHWPDRLADWMSDEGFLNVPHDED
jgi:acetyl esterase/lipase